METENLVPEAAIRWLLGRVHVGTPDAEIEADIRQRTSRATKKVQDACVAYALKCHRENQDLYRAVQSGHF
jgi:hypothetical protein